MVDKNLYHVLGIVGFGFGIGAIGVCFIPIVSLAFAGFGIIFSFIGILSREHLTKPIFGLVLSLLCIVLSIYFSINNTDTFVFYKKYKLYETCNQIEQEDYFYVFKNLDKIRCSDRICTYRTYSTGKTITVHCD